MKKERKGIILAGGTGTRLHPITKAISKQLMPVYDKPMIYYPLSTLMLAGIREFLIITTPKDQSAFEQLLGNGKDWGISIQYSLQVHPNGIAEAFLIGQKFLKDSPSCLILGDNIFHGQDLVKKLVKCKSNRPGASIFAYPVSNPERYGVVEFDSSLKVISLQEKPIKPKSRFAVTGLYFYDETAVERVKELKPSSRGELEITDLNYMYLQNNQLQVELMGRGMVWLDTGTVDSLNDAFNYIRTIEHRQGLKVGSPEEIAWRMGWINDSKLEELAMQQIKSGYGKYLLKLMNDAKELNFEN